MCNVVHGPGKYMLQRLSSVSLALAEIVVLREKVIWLEPAVGIGFSSESVSEAEFLLQNGLLLWR